MEKSFKTIIVATIMALFVAGLLNAVSEAQVNEEWVARYNSPNNNNDEATAIKVATNGNIYVTGGSNGDIVTIKYDNSTGDTIWVRRWDGIGHGDDKAVSMALDPNGNILVVGWTYTGSSLEDYDYITLKYDLNGNLLWLQRYVGIGGEDRASSVATDDNGNAYVTGASWGGNLAGFDYATVKYDPSGNMVWWRSYNGPTSYNDGATDIAVDGLGNVFVTGYSSAEYGNDYATIKYNPSGNTLWERRYDGLELGGEDYAKAMATDSFGNVYVTGWSDRDTLEYPNLDYATVKYSPTGDPLWIARYDYQDHEYDQPQDIAVDAEGYVYVTGWSAEGTDIGFHHCHTIKYAPTGATQWIAILGYPGGYWDLAYALALDQNRNVYVTGHCRTFESTSWHDYQTVKYDSRGQEQWVVTYNGPAGNDDEAAAIAVDDSDNVYITGWSTGIGTLKDYATIKYSQPPPHPDVAITMTPVNPPIRIPANGGSFQYDINVHNTETTPVNLDIWIMMKLLPNGPWTGPYLNANRTLLGGANPTRRRTQNIAGSLEAGTYLYEGRVGDYPDNIWSASNFQFVKLGISDGIWVHDFANYGEDFFEGDATAMEALIPKQYSLNQNYPNPFNPTTSISFSLPEATNLNLSVFDLSGRLVTILVNGWREGGNHQVTFDGINLPSGIYIYHLQTGNFSNSGKMVLVK